MKKRFLLAPLAAFALLSFVVAPAGAQAADPVAELAQLRTDHHYMHLAYQDLERQLRNCQVPEASEIVYVQTSANDISRRAGELAWRLGGTRHAQALTIQRVAESDFMRATYYLQLPEVCYQPPTE